MAHKKLYKEITIGQKQKDSAPPSQRAYRGISTVNPDNDQFNLYDIGLIKQDILNHFHISQGEKLENPNFGTVKWHVLHEPMTESTRELIEKNVADIINSDPRVSATNVIVTTYESGIQIEVELTYLNYNVSESLRLKFDEDNGLLG